MITYYIGNVRGKRKLFRTPRAGAASADNCDVLADFMLDGKVCFVLGDIPYADMRVGEYLAYSRSLKTRLPLSAAAAKELLKRVGLKISLDRRMSSLSRLEFRFVLLAAAHDDETVEVWLNLDGIAYSAFSRRRMGRLLGGLARGFDFVNVAVSDHRFIPKSAKVMAVTKNDVVEGRSMSASRKYIKMRFTRCKRRASLALTALNGRKTLLCDN